MSVHYFFPEKINTATFSHEGLSWEYNGTADDLAQAARYAGAPSPLPEGTEAFYGKVGYFPTIFHKEWHAGSWWTPWLWRAEQHDLAMARRKEVIHNQ